MTVGLVLLVITGILVLCGVGQRVLDRLRLLEGATEALTAFLRRQRLIFKTLKTLIALSQF